MTDIVERLRGFPGLATCQEAADTITTLRAEVERLSEANTLVWADNERLRAVMKTAIRQFEDGNLLSCHRTLCDAVHGRQK